MVVICQGMNPLVRVREWFPHSIAEVKPPKAGNKAVLLKSAPRDNVEAADSANYSLRKVGMTVARMKVRICYIRHTKSYSDTKQEGISYQYTTEFVNKVFTYTNVFFLS